VTALYRTRRLRPRHDDLSPRRARLLGLVALLAGAAACAVNPATGRRELNLVSEEQEIAMGREADAEMQRDLGVYQDAALAAMVERLGSGMAAASERPDLPWTFRLVDDAAVNAFALPGGFVYVTRGILAQLDSEAELAGVLGHEIGHVTARHSASQISRAQLAGIGIGVGAILVPDAEPFLGAAQAGLGLLFLKHGRDDEREADRLGVRYMSRQGHSPEALLEVFGVLDRVSQSAGGGRVPAWLSTPPTPQDRTERIRAELASVPAEVRNASVNAGAYRERLEGLVDGPDPREGYFEDGAFLHPELEFRLRFPQGWQGSNQKASVSARSPREDAVLVLQLAQGSSPEEAARRFTAQEGVEEGGRWVSRVALGPASSRLFSAQGQSGALRGGAAFVAHGGRVYALVAYAAASAWSAREPELRDAVTSFDRLTDPRALAVQPRRIALTRLTRSQSLRELNQSQPSSLPIETLALLNRTEPDAQLAAGTTVKRVVGGPG
jgi:predicted Zn-dependent protease